jgi:hypothetical protein
MSTSWAVRAQRAIASLAATGEPFAADDVIVECKLPMPRRPQQLSAAFRVASRHGVIRPVGVRRSTMPNRRGGLVRVWVGADAPVGE